MLSGTLIVIAIALLIVAFLLRSAFVKPEDWAKRHDKAVDSEADLKAMFPDGIEPPPPHSDQPETGDRKRDPSGGNA